MPPWLATLMVGIAAVTMQWVIGQRAQARLEGQVLARVASAEKDIVEIKDEAKEQWKEISDTRDRVSKVEGRLNGKSSAAHA